MDHRFCLAGGIPFPLAFLVVLTGISCALPVFGDLVLSPAQLDVNSSTESEKVYVLHDGQPVLPGEITKITAGVFKTGKAVPDGDADGKHFSNYSFMFNFTVNDDGSITIAPVKGALEIGDYDFFVHTIHGTASGTIDANLRDSIPARPQTKRKPYTHSYDLVLPDYQHGQLISIDLAPDDRRSYSWTIDGEPHSSGLGLTTFRARPEPGTHVISFVARNADGEVFSEWSGTTRVSAEETIRKVVKKGDKITFSAPGGYDRVTWTYDGKVVSELQLNRTEKPTRKIKFKKKGNHTVSCLVEDSEDQRSRRITWSVSVK